MRFTLFISTLLLAGVGSLANADCMPDPQLVTKSFYSEYLVMFSSDTNDKSIARRYVDPDLIKTIQDDQNSDNPAEVDYYLKSQDYFDEWLSNMKIKEQENDGVHATEILTLGGTPETTSELAVQLKKIDECWLISRVDDNRG